jgi:CheY-like chemotaxis protein
MEEQQKPILLVVDDDQDDQLLLTQAVDALGLEVEPRFLESGREVLDYLYRNDPYKDQENAPWPDLILLDLNMPFMDGRATLKALKEDDKLQEIPVVILTTSRSDEDRRSCQALGASGYFNKPNNFMALKKILLDVYRSWIKRNGGEQQGQPE